MEINCHTLLVEDDRAYARIVLHILRKTRPECSVFHVTDGCEALQYIQGQGMYSDRSTYPLPDLVLLDLRMPKMDGFEVLRMLKGDPRTRHLTVVVMTSSDLSIDQERCEEYGADLFITKPSYIPELAAQLDSVYADLIA